MNLPDIHPVAQVALIICLGLVVGLAMWRKIPISLRGGPVTVDVSVARQLEQIKTEVVAINKAVNNVPKGAPPLVERVERSEALARWSADAIHQLAAHVGCPLDEPPPDHRTIVRSAE